MQLKSSNSVAMEKRVDLASLFCMIGRHGPAVAVAVIAVVSVLAGFIIYRNVKGKRRRAAAEAADGDGKSRGAQRDEPLLQPDTEPESRSSVEATGMSEETLPNKNADLTQTELRNRRAATEQTPHQCPPSQMTFEPEKYNTSLVRDSVSVAERLTEETNASLQVNVARVDVDGDACQQDLTDMKEAEEVQDDCSKPAEICEGPEEVPESQEEVVTAVSSEILQKDAPVCISNSLAFSKQNFQISQGDDGQKDGQTPQTDLEEHIVPTGVPISVKEAEVKIESFHQDAAEFSEYDSNCPSPDEEMKSEVCVGDLQHKPEPLHHLTEDDQNVDHSLVCDVMVKDVGEDHLKVDVKVLKLKPEEKGDSSSSQEHDIEREKMLSSCGDEHGGLSEVLGAALPCLNQSAKLEIELGSNGLCSPEIGLNPVPDLACLKENWCEKSDANVVEIESVEHLEFSFQSDPGAIICENVTLNAPEKSTEMFNSGLLPSLQEKLDQMQTEAADMTEGIKPPICETESLTFDQLSELTWSSSGVGGESGISSMTISPDLQDPNECAMTPEKLVPSVLHNYLQSEEHSDAQSRFFSNDDVVVSNDLDQSDVPAASSPQECWSKSTDEHAQRVMVPSVVLLATGDGLAGELKQDVAIKAKVVEGEKEDDNVKTEINIMEATMDNNEWITDGNHINPWLNFSVSSSAQNSQMDMVSMKEAHSTLPVDSYPNTDHPSSMEAEQNCTLPLTDKDLETGRKIVAVQPMPQSVSVTFCTHYLTQSPYQKVAITGNQQELGNWKGFVPLERSKDGHWATVVSLPVESHVEWKFVVVDKGAVCRWEECGNRLLDTGYGDDLHVHKWWGIL